MSGEKPNPLAQDAHEILSLIAGNSGDRGGEKPNPFAQDAHEILSLIAGRPRWYVVFRRDGRLGHGDTSDSIYPRKIQCEPIAFVATGQSHAVALTFDGKALVWGRGFSGQLGLGDSKSHWSPQKLEVPNSKATGSRVVGAACGGSHSAVVLDSGQVWSFGRGVEGQVHSPTVPRKGPWPALPRDLARNSILNLKTAPLPYSLVMLHERIAQRR